MDIYVCGGRTRIQMHKQLVFSKGAYIQTVTAVLSKKNIYTNVQAIGIVIYTNS